MNIIFYKVEREWILSPRGRASVIIDKIEREGYLKSFKPFGVEEGDEPTATITINIEGNIP